MAHRKSVEGYRMDNRIAARVAKRVQAGRDTFVRYRSRSHLNDHNVAVYKRRDGSMYEVIENVVKDRKVSKPRPITEEESEETLSVRGLARVMSELER